MSNIKWFLLIASLALGPEVSSRGLQPLMGQNDGVYCNYICGDRYFSGTTALCLVLYENNINILVGRNPSYTSWQFSPMNTRDQHLIMSNPEALCDRIHKGDKYDGRNRCFPLAEKKQRKSDYFEYVGDEDPFLTPYDDLESDDCDNLEYMSPNYRRDLIAELDEAVNKVKEAYNSSSKRSESNSTSEGMKDVEEIISTAEGIKEVVKTLTPTEDDSSPVKVKINYDALPEDIGSYTSEEWTNITKTLAKAKDDAKHDKQPNLKELIPALDKALPVLDAITIVSSENKPKRQNLRFLGALVDMLGSIIGASINAANKYTHSKNQSSTQPGTQVNPQHHPDNQSPILYGRRRKEEKEVIAEDLKLKMKKVKEEATNLDVEVPKELIDDVDKEVEKLSSAIDSPEKAKKRCASILKAIEGLMHVFTPGLGGLYPENGKNQYFGHGNQAHPAQPAQPAHPAVPAHVNDGKHPAAPAHVSGGHPAPPAHTSSVHPAAPVHVNGGKHPAAPAHVSGGHPAAPVHVNGGKYPAAPVHLSVGHPAVPVHTSSVHPVHISGVHPAAPANINRYDIDIHHSNEMCEIARKNLCERQDIMIYTSDNTFCMTSLKTNFICNHHSMNCLQDLDYMLESVQWY